MKPICELGSGQFCLEEMIPLRRNMTDAIRDRLPDTPHKGQQYKNYTDLAYRAATGMSAAELRRKRGADTFQSGHACFLLTTEEAKTVEQMFGRIALLLENGMTYPQIKERIMREVEEAQ